jgi:hypothetical protein
LRSWLCRNPAPYQSVGSTCVPPCPRTMDVPALRNGLYGRCVFAGDNNVVDSLGRVCLSNTWVASRRASPQGFHRVSVPQDEVTEVRDRPTSCRHRTKLADRQCAGRVRPPRHRPAIFLRCLIKVRRDVEQPSEIVPVGGLFEHLRCHHFAGLSSAIPRRPGMAIRWRDRTRALAAFGVPADDRF